MVSFIGREEELSKLSSFFSQGLSSFIVIKGRRRIGKSRLVEEFAKDKLFYRFMGLPPEKGVTAQMQRDDFSQRLQRYFSDFPKLKADDWGELFELLAQKTQKGKVVILLDEISWMASGDPSFLGKLKSAWDERFKKNSQLMLIICGSVSSWIEKNILSSTAFLGRVQYVMTLNELSLQHCFQFWTQVNVSAYDRLKYLSITGGVPLYLESMNPQMPVEDNIQALCFDKGGLLFREFDNIFHDLFDKRSDYYKHIVSVLVQGPLDMEHICKKLKIASSGVMTDYMSDLVEAGFLKRDYSWSFKTGKRGKLSRYRLSDNYLRFYLRYIETQKEKIERSYHERYVLTALPEWSIIVGLQFENLVLNNRSLIWQALGLSSQDIINDGAYFQRKTNQSLGTQIDYLIQTRYNNLFVCEIKFSRNEIKSYVIDEVKEKIIRLVRPKHFSCFPVLIYANEISDAVIDANYFCKIINLGQLGEGRN